MYFLNRYSLLSSILLLIVIIPVFNKLSMAESINSFIGKIVYSRVESSGNKNTFIFRVRVLDRRTGNIRGGLITLKKTSNVETDLYYNLNKIHDEKKYGLFQVYKKGRGWQIISVNSIDVKIDKSKKFLNEDMDPSTIDNNATLFILNKETNNKSIHLGNSGIVIGK